MKENSTPEYVKEKAEEEEEDIECSVNGSRTLSSLEDKKGYLLFAKVNGLKGKEGLSLCARISDEEDLVRGALAQHLERSIRIDYTKMNDK